MTSPRKWAMRISFIKLGAAVPIAALVLAHLTANLGQAAAGTASREQATSPTPQSSTSPRATSLELPITFERRVGDLDGMEKRHQIRALVVPGRSSFFYDKGQPHGIFYEAMEEFQRFANEKLKSGSLKLNVVFIPVRPDQLERAL